MKLSEIADELSKLNESEQEPDEAETEAEKAELEKFLVKHPEVTDEMMLSAMRVAAEAEKTDPLTAHAAKNAAGWVSVISHPTSGTRSNHRPFQRRFPATTMGGYIGS
jgi:hypothetical protein